MRSPGEQHRQPEGSPGASAPPRPAGLLEKLMAVIRPEFRHDELVFDPQDPVFGGPACRVPGCGRPGRSVGMCTAHHLRWSDAGKPSLDRFAAATSPGFTPPPLAQCQAPGCGHGVAQNGLCPQHRGAWKRAGYPDLRQWLAGLPAVKLASPPPACPVPDCELWVQGSTPFCWRHGRLWISRSRPAVSELIASSHRQETLPAYERIDLRPLESQLKLEMQYALQRRRDDETIKTRPSTVRGIVRFLAASGVTSLLDWPEATWKERFPTPSPKSTTQSALVIYARRRIEELAVGRGWDIEYPRDVWRLRSLGIDGQHATLSFAAIPQPWLKDLAKRWARWRLATGTGPSWAYRCVQAITRFAAFLAAAGIEHLGQVDRAVLERYLADLHRQLGGKKVHNDHIGLLNGFLQAVRQHQWDDTLPPAAMFFAEDYPKRPKLLPRALAEHVMAQVEHPASLARFDSDAYRLITIILIRCGLRVTDAVKLPFDCIVTDASGAPYLRYYNHKMKREALVPIDEELRQDLRRQQQHLLSRWPGGVAVLFPRATANIDGHRPVGSHTYRDALDRWLERCDVRDENGRPVRLTPHQWRHTLGTRLINKDVPQEVVRRILDHDSPEMTAHYARLSDTTIRRHWEKARKVNASGETVTLDPGGPLADAAWAKQRLGQATQALPNGYCGLPIVKTCPHANACLTCPMFITTAEFLPRHHEHHRQVLQIISAAEATGQARLAEMNRQVAGNLEKIITALGNSDPGTPGAADAC